ncbi:MAG: DUF1353 domain-containing protein [Verrucomicrobiales bacterium]|nr:DUF1353 domain-containing protein [Verrucomicrobiales bacterium]
MRTTASLICFVLILLSISQSVLGDQWGKFEGKPNFDWLEDGRRMILKEDFNYELPVKDSETGKAIIWTSPAGTVVDGASIPQPLWSFVGSPFAGKFRNASIIHDHQCEQKMHPWRFVHEVFYWGCLAEGVEPKKALAMYTAIMIFGPKWTVDHELIESKLSLEQKKEEYKRIKKEIEMGEPSIKEVDRHLEEILRLPSRHYNFHDQSTMVEKVEGNVIINHRRE